LVGETVNKIFDFVQASAIARELAFNQEPYDLNQIEVSYFFKPEDNMLNTFICVPRQLCQLFLLTFLFQTFSDKTVQ
jgi:hypothetical protein